MNTYNIQTVERLKEEVEEWKERCYINYEAAKDYAERSNEKRKEVIKLEKELDAALAKCAEMRSLKGEPEMGGCTLAGPGRGDCEHFIGLPGKSIPGQHDGPDDTVAFTAGIQRFDGYTRQSLVWMPDTPTPPPPRSGGQGDSPRATLAPTARSAV